MKAIRYTLYAIAGLVVLLVLGGVIFAMTFNPNRYKPEIERLVKEKTGRTLSLKGDLQVAVWPALGAKVNGVTLSEHGSDQQFLALDSAHASVALLPLLHGQAIVDGIRVSGLKATVIREKDGRFNFSDLTEPQPAANEPKPRGKQESKEQAQKKADQRQAQGGQAVAFDIGSVNIDRSAVTYIDKASGQELAVSDLKLSTGKIAEKADGKLSLAAALKGKNPDLDVKLDVSGGYKFDLAAKSFAVSKLDAKVTGAAAGVTSLNVNAKGDVSANPDKNEYKVSGLALDVKGVQDKQNLEAHIAAPELLIAANSAKGAAVTANLKLNEGQRNIDAQLKLSGVEGSAKALTIPQLSADIAMADPSLPQKNVKIPVTGSLKADLEKQTANADLSSKFDESNIQAKFGLAKFSPPAYQFDVNVDKLNLDRYSAKQAQQKPVSTPKEEGKAPAPNQAPAPAAQKKDEDTPLDLSFLKGLNANGRLQIGALQTNGLKLANVKADVHAANGKLDIAPHSASLYEGAASGAITAMADGRVAVKENLNGVAVGPLLRDLAQKDVLEGKGNVALEVNAAGKSVNAMKKALAGSARVQLKDGAIKGINLAEVFRKAKTALGSQEARAQAGEAQKTDFSELNASFTIKNGVAHNEDLDVKSPLFRISGKGDVDIGNSSIDYVTSATVVASTRGQGGEDLAQLSGLTVPVRLVGPFDALSYKVDYAAAATNLAKSKAGEKIRGALEERLGIKKPAAEAEQSGQGSSAQQQPPDRRQETIDKLKGLLGR
ncbi:MAG TPA: AsmA family protein [Burkholderiales bacterium]|nr:AsmA family protein [Burkholderiales bacterium]